MHSSSISLSQQRRKKFGSYICWVKNPLTAQSFGPLIMIRNIVPTQTNPLKKKKILSLAAKFSMKMSNWIPCHACILVYTNWTFDISALRYNWIVLLIWLRQELVVAKIMFQPRWERENVEKTMIMSKMKKKKTFIYFFFVKKWCHCCSYLWVRNM